MRKKIALVLATLLACALLFASCAMEKSAAEPMVNDDSAYDVLNDELNSLADSGLPEEKALYKKASFAPPPSADAESAPSEAPAPSAAAGRKLVKNITADIETLDFDACLQAVEAKAAALGGYIHSKQTGDDVYRGSSPQLCRRASLVLRIPAQSLDEFKQSLDAGGKVTSLNESVNDETMAYNDTAAHIEALQVEREALLTLMAKAKDLKDLLMLQERITDINRQLNSLEGQLRLLNDQVALSTVTLTVVEVVKLTPKPQPEQGYFARTWNGFKSSVRSVVSGIGSFISGLIIALPYLLVIGAPVAPVIIIVLRRRKKRKSAV